MSGTTSMTKIRNEIEKNDLIVLCANCHREVHAGMVDDLELTRKSIFLSGAQLCLV